MATRLTLAALLAVAVSTATPMPVEQAPGSSPRESPDAAHLDVPLVKQPYMLCLAASVSMVLRFWGLELSPRDLADQVPLYKDGTTGRDYVRLLESLGFRGFLVQPPFEDVLGHVAKGRPVIVSLPRRASDRHAMVLVGFDTRADTVQLNDPESGEKRTQPLRGFRQEWEKGGRWALLIVPK